MSLSHSLLITTLLASVALTQGRSISGTLKCIGKSSEYTDSDCQQLGDSIGCYYQDVLFRYMSCAKICNGVELYSINEERCRNGCPDFYRSQCSSSQQMLLKLQHPVDTTLVAQPTTDKSNTSPTDTVEPADRLATDSDYALYQLLVVIAAFSVVVCVLLVVVTAVCVCKREEKCCSKSVKDPIQYIFVDGRE